jgi:hypothetical protein
VPLRIVAVPPGLRSEAIADESCVLSVVAASQVLFLWPSPSDTQLQDAGSVTTCRPVGNDSCSRKTVFWETSACSGPADRPRCRKHDFAGGCRPVDMITTALMLIIFPDQRDWYKANWAFRQSAQDIEQYCSPSPQASALLETSRTCGTLRLDELAEPLRSEAMRLLASASGRTLKGEIPGWIKDGDGELQYRQALSELLQLVSQEPPPKRADAQLGFVGRHMELLLSETALSATSTCLGRPPAHVAENTDFAGS